MKALDAVCLRIAGDLKQLETEIAALEADLESFEKCAARYPFERVELRLLAIYLRIKIKVAELLIEHNNQGSICIMTVNKMIGVAWFEQEPIVNDASKLWTKPVTTLPEGQFFAFIKHLLQELYDGNWEPAVKWLNTKAVWLNPGEHLK
jgi:hypothetical protein